MGHQFTPPKDMFLKPHFHGVKRVPRKFKKKYKHILCGSRYDFLTLGQKLWYIQSLNNPKYNKFLINLITGYDNYNNFRS